MHFTAASSDEMERQRRRSIIEQRRSRQGETSFIVIQRLISGELAAM